MPRLFRFRLAHAALFASASACGLAACAPAPTSDNVIVATPPLAPTVKQDGRDVYRLTYEGGAPALVTVTAAGAASLELLVFDARGRKLCQGQRGSQEQVCEWKPARTEEFQVEVHNRGARAAEYRLSTN